MEVRSSAQCEGGSHHRPSWAAVLGPLTVPGTYLLLRCCCCEPPKSTWAGTHGWEGTVQPEPLEEAPGSNPNKAPLERPAAVLPVRATKAKPSDDTLRWRQRAEGGNSYLMLSKLLPFD